MFGSRTKSYSQFERVAEKVYTWRSADQSFSYYDKDTKERVLLPKDAKLIPLTATNSVTGVRERDHGKATERYNNVSSNEFIDYKNEIVRVREYDRLDGTKNILFEGVYSPDIKEAISGVQYCKFTKNIYCLLEDEVIKVSLSGASLTAWIEFEDKLKQSKTYLTDGHCVTLGESIHHTHGSVNYYAPTFVLGDISQEENTKADEIAAEVEDKLAKNRAAASDTAPAQIQTGASQPVAQAQTEAEDDGQINLEDIPF